MDGQAYDGASNMSGKTNGAASHISAQYPLALYTHCASHCLNLAVVSSFEETSVHNMIGVVNWLYVFFFAQPKRQKNLEEAIHNTQPESTVKKLKDLCRTRWVERIDAFDRIKTLHSSIVACFESISAEGASLWSPDSDRCQYSPSSHHIHRIHQWLLSSLMNVYNISEASPRVFKRKPKTLYRQCLRSTL